MILTCSLRIFLLSHNAEIPSVFPFLYTLQYSTYKRTLHVLHSLIQISSSIDLCLSALPHLNPNQLHKDIYTAQQSDKHCKDIITNIINPESPEFPDPKPQWSLDNQQLLCYDNQIWILDTDDLWL